MTADAGDVHPFAPIPLPEPTGVRDLPVIREAVERAPELTKAPAADPTHE